MAGARYQGQAWATRFKGGPLAPPLGTAALPIPDQPEGQRRHGQQDRHHAGPVVVGGGQQRQQDQEGQPAADLPTAPELVVPTPVPRTFMLGVGMLEVRAGARLQGVVGVHGASLLSLIGWSRAILAPSAG